MPQLVWLRTIEPFEGNTLKLKTVGTEMIWLQCRAPKIVVINSDDFIQLSSIQCITMLNVLLFQPPPWVLNTESVIVSGWLIFLLSSYFFCIFSATFQLLGGVSSQRWKTSYPWKRTDWWQADRRVVHGSGLMLRPIVAKNVLSLVIPPRSMCRLPIRTCNLLKLFFCFTWHAELK